jgi:glycosyltransferase involved in cell wall biosynthesis
MTHPEPVRLLLASGGRGPFGAAERVLWELATRLPESRYAVRVVLPPEPGIDELAQSLEERGLLVERWREPRSRWDLAGHVRTIAALRRLRPEILHLHADAESSHRRLPATAKAAGVPHVVVTQHGLPDDTPWRELAKADAVTAVCASAADRLVRKHALPRDRVRVITHGADAPDELSELPAARRLRDRLGAQAFRPLWVTAARLEEVKGQDVLVEALGKLSQRGLDFVVALAGEGARRGALERRVAELGLTSRVHFLGPVESLGPVLLAADAVVLPSLEEAMPLSLLEAMARGRVVVASHVGGVPEVIEHGVHGLLVPPGDAEALAAALAELHGKVDLARRLGQHAADQILGALTWDHVVARFEAVYDEVLGLAGFTPEPGPRRRGALAGGGG